MNDNSIDSKALVAVFLAEAEERLAAVEQSLMALESAPDDAELLHEVFRGAHTIKGGAATVGLDGIVDIAHVMEDLLDALRDHKFAVSQSLINFLLECCDSIRAAIRGTEGGAGDLAGAAKSNVAGGVAGATVGLRVALPKLDTMMNLAGEIAIARGRLRALIDEMTPSRDLANAQEHLDRLCSDLQTEVMRIRTVPIGPVFQQQTRVVRDLAQTAGKLVQLRIEGEDVEIDTAIVDRLRDPLTHMVRNAIDHGIERPDVRAARGKPSAGVVTLRAAHEGGMVVIEVSDDGAGLDVQRIAARARDIGLIGEGAEVTPDDLQRLIFSPGFTTAETVTEVSGRGVGMDVVSKNIAALRGSISVSSAPNRGTTITIRLPLTLAIIDSLAVGVSDETYIFPLDTIVECIDVNEHDLEQRSEGVLDVRGRAIPFIRLAAAVGVPSDDASRRAVVIVRRGEKLAGIVVDRLLGGTQAVIKPLANPLPHHDGIAGATILGNGAVAMIVDINRLLARRLLEVA